MNEQLTTPELSGQTHNPTRTSRSGVEQQLYPARTRLGKTARLLGKYGSTSLLATGADFTAFHLALTYIGATPVQATIIGRSVGSVVAFLLHRAWVFKSSQKRDGNVLRLKYVLGIFIGMGLNAAGVWLLNGFAGLDPWPARVVTASAVWFFVFLFNKKIVFG